MYITDRILKSNSETLELNRKSQLNRLLIRWLSSPLLLPSTIGHPKKKKNVMMNMMTKSMTKVYEYNHPFTQSLVFLVVHTHIIRSVMMGHNTTDTTKIKKGSDQKKRQQQKKQSSNPISLVCILGKLTFDPRTERNHRSNICVILVRLLNVCN